MTGEFSKVLVTAKRLADEAGQPLDKFLAAATVLEKYNLEQLQARQATSDEKAAILRALDSINGAISEDLPITDILASAGVRSIQGTKSFARYQVKRLLIAAPQSR
jgi:hypothetical protein